MVSKIITYKDYNGVDRTETFWFNISKPELIDWQINEGYGLDKELDKLTKSIDQKQAIDIFKKIILKSVGEKSEDGRRFVKRNGKVAEEFMETPAYEKLYMELATDDKKASEFVKGIVPQLTEAEKKEVEVRIQQKNAGFQNPENVIQ